MRYAARPALNFYRRNPHALLGTDPVASSGETAPYRVEFGRFTRALALAIPSAAILWILAVAVVLEMVR